MVPTVTLTLLATDRAAHASTYVSIGAGLCAMITVLGIPLWRAFRTARKERAHQTGMITRLHGGLFGEPAIIENGVTVAPHKDGLIDRVTNLETQLSEGSAPLLDMKATLDRNHKENAARLDRHEERIIRVEQVAGAAATEASAAKDRLEFLSGRWWERVESVEMRNRMLTSALEQHGFEVGAEEDDDGEPAELHDP